MIPMYGATLALAGFWDQQQTQVNLGRAWLKRDWGSAQDAHPASAHVCVLCQTDVLRKMNFWLAQQRILQRREIGRKLRGKALKQYLDECLTEARNLGVTRVSRP